MLKKESEYKRKSSARDLKRRMIKIKGAIPLAYLEILKNKEPELVRKKGVQLIQRVFWLKTTDVDITNAFEDIVNKEILNQLNINQDEE